MFSEEKQLELKKVLNSRSLVALLEYSLSSLSKNDKISALHPKIFDQMSVHKHLDFKEGNIFEYLLTRVNLVEELDKFKVISLKQAKDFFSVIASKLIHK